ncbi:hypothetical protein [Acinetobacter brisouii]|uniref:hypothetical protein n=1 Tax=Acinetobacter brisouii TaxID=396323 RepID=UPI00124DFA64|nr:hypothetical protein [Acinetobacter brisouii]
MFLTAKQLELLVAVAKKNPDGTLLDLDQIAEGQSYKTTKAATRFIIRSLMTKGLLEKAGTEKRRDRQRTILQITPQGGHFTKKYIKTLKDELVES